jgi:hypothetical protein
MRIIWTVVFYIILFGTQAAYAGGDRPEALLTIEAPQATKVRISGRHGVPTLKYFNRGGLLTTTQWPLSFKITSRTAVGFVARRVLNEEREALVLTDPDECFNLNSLVDDLLLTSFDFACAGLIEDELYIEVQTEKHDTFGVFDNDTTGNSAIRARLIDDKASDPAPRNTPYLKLFDGKTKAVGPKTGGRPDSGASKPDELDGYGYGADDDLASLVIMADIGGARVFDENFDLTPGVIRNMAGFVNTVSAVDLNGRGATTIRANLHVLAGVFEPIAIIDTNVTDPSLAGFEYALRVDSGPVTGINLDEDFPTDVVPGGANAFYDELLSQYYPARVKVRAVVVNGEAPDFIYDMNGDGKYTANDVRLAGYKLLTNEVSINLTLTHENLLTEAPDSKCPPRTLIHSDLDGNLERGDLPECLLTSGSSRARRAPR